MATNFKIYKRTLAAGQSINLNAIGTAFRCTAGDAVFFVEPNQDSKVEMQAGLGFAGEIESSSWRITNGPTAQTIEFYIGNGVIFDNRLVGNIAISGGLKSAGNAAANHGAVAVGAAAVLIKQATAGRSNIVVQNLSANDLFVGVDNTVTVANGIKVGAGQSATLTHAGAVWGIASGAASDIRYLEETV